MKLVTIIGEALAREPLRKLLGEVGTHGYTLFTVEGEGNHGSRTADIQEFANIQLQVIVPPEVSDKLLQRLEKEFFHSSRWSPTKPTSASCGGKNFKRCNVNDAMGTGAPCGSSNCQLASADGQVMLVQ